MTSSNQGLASDDIRPPSNEVVRSQAPPETDFVDIFARFVVVTHAWERFAQAVAKRVDEYESGRRRW